MFNVVILAGASKRGELEEQEGVNNKSFILIDERFMLEVILDTLRKVKLTEKIVITGPEEDLKKLQGKGYVFDIVPQKDSLLDNLLAGMQKMDPRQPCIVMSADIPLITAEALEDFFTRCAPHDCDLYYPLISRENCEKKFSEVKRTYMHTKEDTFTGGNLMMVKPDWIIRKIDDLNIYFSYRKKPWKLVQTLPFKLIVKYIFRTLSLKEVEEYLSDLFGIKAVTVITPFAEIGVDVDKPSDIALVRKVIA